MIKDFESLTDATTNDDILDWDAELDDDDSKSPSLLPAGEYSFKVVSMERGWFNGSAKLPPCNQAVLKLKLTGDDGQTGCLTDKIKLCKKLLFKLSDFFKSIGMKKSGEAIKMDWDSVPGATGRVLIEVAEIPSQFGPLKINRVKKYLPMESLATPFTTK